MMSDSDTIECPRCLGNKVVKNGFVRGVQRYRCNFCKTNFSLEFECRWPKDSRVVNLLLLADGESLESISNGCGATQETVSRWLLDVKEHKDWFIEFLADAVYYAVIEHSNSLEEAFERQLSAYRFISKDTSEFGVSALATKLWDLLELRGKAAG